MAFLLLFEPVRAQTSVDGQENYLLEGRFQVLECDKLGNIYLVNSNAELVKFDRHLKPLFRFSTIRLGRLTSLDVTNPQKLVLFFMDYQVVVILDNTLSEIKRLNLSHYNLWNCSAVAISGDNQLWVYNADIFRLIKLSDSGKELIASNELYDETLGRHPVISVVERNNIVYLNTGQGIIKMNNLGQYISSDIELKSELIQVLPESIAYFSGNRITIESRRPEIIRQKVEKTLPGAVHDFAIYGSDLLIVDSRGLYKRSID